jgi:MFS family permease
MQNIALAWLVLSLTHSPVAVGILALCQFLPFTFLGLFAGVLVDRCDPRRMVIWTQAVSMAIAAAVAAVSIVGAEVWELYLLAALRGAVLVLDAPSRQALTYQMVGRDTLPNAVALNSSLFNGARVVGPALGGLLVAFVGVQVCFILNAASFVAVLVGLLLMRAHELFPLDRPEKPPILRGTLEALSYARRNSQVLLVLGMVLVMSTLAFNFNVLLPVLATATLHEGPSIFGVISACFGAGALVGALLSAGLGRASWRVFLVASAGLGGSELLLAPQDSLAGAGVALFAMGVFFTLWTSTANSTLQLRAPDHMRGRVVGLYFYAFNGAAPIGGLLVGWLCARGGTELSLVVAGVAGLAMTAFATHALHVDRLVARKLVAFARAG